MNYSNSVALITGASSGIGEEFVKALHARGCSIIAVARREERLAKLCANLNATRAGSANMVPVDLSNSAGLEVVVQCIKDRQVDILINNAGRGSFGYFDELSCVDELNMVSLNIRAAMALTHAVIPQMRMRRSGAIVNLASIAAFQPLPYMATYSATKAFDLIHSIALHFELRRFGIRVLAVCPGPVATEFAGVARVPGKMTGAPRDPVEAVVAHSLAALERGKALVLPGVRGKILGTLSRVLPVWISTWVIERVLKSTLDSVRQQDGVSRAEEQR